MGMRFRRSFQILPGIKLNINKNSVSVSAGVKGAKVSVNSKGKTTTTVGIPGTGISYSATSSGKSKNKTQNTPQPATPSPTPPNPKNPVSKSFWIVVLILIAVSAITNIIVGGAIFCIYLILLIRKQPKSLKWSILSVILGIAAFLYMVFGLILMYTPDLETLTISTTSPTAVDINETLKIDWSYTPESASISDIKVEISDNSIAEVTLENNILQLQPKTEGEVTVFLQCDDVESNAVTFYIVDEQRIAAEQERIEAEKKAEEERIAAEQAEQAKQEQIAAEQEQQTQSNSPTVYVTPTGKRYHYDNNCNGGTYRATTLDDALSRGLTPCGKCAS